MSFETQHNKPHHIKCICETLKAIKEAQDEIEERCVVGCFNENMLTTPQTPIFDTIPFMLQTPYGNPFYTWGGIGTDNCFITVFFKVVDLDPKRCCAKLKLLKPNVPIIDSDSDCIELCKICEVDYVTETSDCITIELNCYSALKCLEPSFVKSDRRG